ncbi:hypothetical protein ACQ86N_22710 [Puia sp. P3]|jgi:hypothetical protein|uniref:hypothetical protein n=1 Tax=Puia sp. P3 TaxID=3423952 RepID=UPI003D6774A4
MTAPFRNLTLLAHIIFSVGWLGAVAGFLSLAVTGVTSKNALIIRATYLAMEPVTWWVIVPLAFAALLTGLLLSLGTKWGMFDHYWILAKLLINLVSIILLLLHTQAIDHMARAAANAAISKADLDGPGVKLVDVSIAALIALLVATALSVYKPRGLTRYGWRKQYNKPREPNS